MNSVKLVSDQPAEKWLNIIKYIPREYQHLPLCIEKRPVGSGPYFTITYQNDKPSGVVIYFDFLFLATDQIDQTEE